MRRWKDLKITTETEKLPQTKTYEGKLCKWYDIVMQNNNFIYDQL